MTRGMTEHRKLDLIIDRFGLTPPRGSYCPTVDGLGEYIAELCGNKRPYVSAQEVASPFHPEIAERLYGTPDLVPGDRRIAGVEGAEHEVSAEDFRGFGAVWAVLRPFRKDDGRPLTVVNWYRPPRYNKAVGGAETSDHLTAHAVDVRITGASHRKALLGYLSPLMRDEQLLLSVGAYTNRVHVGVRSPVCVQRGRSRRWGAQQHWR